MEILGLISKLVIHSTLTYSNMDVDMEWVRRVHVDENGWEDVGYHVLIKRDGEIEYGRDMKYQGAHAKGNNHDSLGIALAGGLGDDDKPFANFTFLQYKALLSVVDDYPGVEVIGHRDVSAKDCPSFSVQDLLGDR